MLTIIAWMVFLPAVVWNVILFAVIWSDLMDPKIDWRSRRNLRDLVLSLTVLFIPGVYLFGWF